MSSPYTFFLTLYVFFSISTFISHSSHALGSFTFNIHHLYSHAVRQILPLHALPDEGTVDYYAAMVRTDHFVHSRRLLEDQPPLTFFSGNQTVRINPLGLYGVFFFFFFCLLILFFALLVVGYRFELLACCDF